MNTLLFAETNARMHNKYILHAWLSFGLDRNLLVKPLKRCNVCLMKKAALPNSLSCPIAISEWSSGGKILIQSSRWLDPGGCYMHAVIRFNFFSIPFLLWAVIALVHNVISSGCSSCISGMSKLFHLSVFGSPQASCWSSKGLVRN